MILVMPLPSSAVISYGQRSSSELLLSYGFSPDPTTHPHETLPLVIGLQPGDPLKVGAVPTCCCRGALLLKVLTGIYDVLAPTHPSS
jgi:hypothetical protein